MKTSHRIKLLCLALLALVATSATSATGAQAGTYPSTISAVKAGHFFWTQLGLMQCTPSFEGGLVAASGELTLTPTYGSSCTVRQKEVHVNNNGCDFKLHAGSKVETDVVSGSTDIVCPLGKAIDFEVTFSPACHVRLPAQEGLSVLTFRNFTEVKWSNVEWNASEIHYTLEGNCPVATGEYEDGLYAGGSTVKATHEGVETTFRID